MVCLMLLFSFCVLLVLFYHSPVTKLGGYAGITMSGCLVHVWNESWVWQEVGMLGLTGCNSISSEAGTGVWDSSNNKEVTILDWCVQGQGHSECS